MGQGIMAALLGDAVERDAYVDRETLLAGVQRTIMCEVSGAILDIRTAVMLTATGADGRTMTQVVMTGAAYDGLGGAEHITRTQAELPTGVTISAIDGRDYTGKGTLRAPILRARRAIAAEQS